MKKRKPNVVDYNVSYCKVQKDLLRLTYQSIADSIESTPQYISHCFHGNCHISIPMRKKLAAFFGTDFWGNPIDPNFVTVEYNGKKYKIEPKLFYQWVMDKPSRSEIVQGAMEVKDENNYSQ